jgi:sugar phosphate isomerase/epimerase
MAEKGDAGMFASFNARAVGLSLPAASTIDLAARAGFGGADLMVRDLLAAGEDPAALRSRMDGHGLRGGAFPMPVGWRGDAEAFARDLADLPRLAEAAAVLGLSRTATWVMPETPESPDTPAGRDAHLASVVALHRDRLGRIARVLDGHGIRLGLEVIGVASSRTGRGLPFVARMADLDPRLGTLRAESPNIGILVDGWHLYAAGETFDAVPDWGPDRVVWVHVADLPATSPPDPSAMIDGDRGLPGENGAIDARGLLRRLAEARYDGPVTAEPMPGCRTLGGAGRGPEWIAGRVAEALRSVWPVADLRA